MIGSLLVLASVAALGGTAIAARSARFRAVEDAFRLYGAEPRREFGGVVGVVDGVVLHYAVETPVGLPRKNGTRTTCSASLSGERPAFEMDLRPKTRWNWRDGEAGRAIDLSLDDERFDDSFVVEAAPAAVARDALDRQTRTALLTFHPCSLSVAGNEMRFSTHQSLGEIAEIRRVIELCAHVGARLDAMREGQEERLAMARSAEASGYRGANPEGLRGLALANPSKGEVAAFQRMRARRTALRAAQAAVALAVGIVAYLWLAASHR
jgi:hypothetical protein